MLKVFPIVYFIIHMVRLTDLLESVRDVLNPGQRQDGHEVENSVRGEDISESEDDEWSL